MGSQEQNFHLQCRDTEKTHTPGAQLLLPFRKPLSPKSSSAVFSKPLEVMENQGREPAIGRVEMSQVSNSHDAEVMVEEASTYHLSTGQIIRISDDAKRGEPEYTFLYDKLQEADVFRYCFDIERRPDYPMVSSDGYTLHYSGTSLVPADEDDNEEEMLGAVFKVANKVGLANKIRAWYDGSGLVPVKWWW